MPSLSGLKPILSLHDLRNKNRTKLRCQLPCQCRLLTDPGLAPNRLIQSGTVQRLGLKTYAWVKPKKSLGVVAYVVLPSNELGDSRWRF